MFGIGGMELFLILLFGFLIVGPDKLPDLAKTVGKAISKFRNAQEEMSGIIKKTDVYDPESDEPFKNPLDALGKASDALSKKDASKKVEKPVAATTAAKSSSSSAPAATTAKAETFSERKARYDRERAAKKAADKAAAEEAAAVAAAAAAAAVKAGDAPAPIETKITEAADATTSSASAAASAANASSAADAEASSEAAAPSGKEE